MRARRNVAQPARVPERPLPAQAKLRRKAGLPEGLIERATDGAD